MSNNLNLCQFIGRLGQDLELKYMPDGKAVANLSIAVSESWKDKTTGKQEERTEWVRVVAFGRLAEVMGEYLKKGSRIYVSGKMRTRKWQDQSGQDRYSTEIVANQMEMLDSKGDAPQAPAAPRQQAGTAPAPQGGAENQSAPASFDDDIPF